MTYKNKVEKAIIDIGYNISYEFCEAISVYF